MSTCPKCGMNVAPVCAGCGEEPDDRAKLRAEMDQADKSHRAVLNVQAALEEFCRINLIDVTGKVAHVEIRPVVEPVLPLTQLQVEIDWKP